VDLKIIPCSAAAASTFVHGANCVVPSGGSSSSIFVQTKSKIRFAKTPDRMPSTRPMGL
jgi:hypothetical protein